MASLLQLPSTLVETIYTFLGDQDAFQIRLVCRTLRDDVLYPFKVRFFGERKICMTEDSLQHLIVLSNIGLLSSIRIITLVDDERQWDHPNLWSTIRARKAVIRDLHPSQVRQSEHQFQELKCEMEKVARLEDMLVHFLWKLTNPVSINFKLVHWMMNEHICDSFAEPTACFLRAFATAGSDVSAITVRPGSLPLGTFRELGPNLQQLCQCFSRLRKLDISVPCAREGSNDFVKFLALVPAVNIMGLRFATRSMDKEGATADFFSRIAKYTNFSELSELCLTDIKFHMCDLEIFLKGSPLQKLVLKESGLQNNQSLLLKDLLRRKYLLDGPKVDMQWEDRDTGHSESLYGQVGAARLSEARRDGNHLRFVIRQVLVWPT